MTPVHVFVCSLQDDRTSGERLALFAAEYAQSMNLPPITANMVYGTRGKPYFDESHLHFSISHSGEFWACAFSDAPLGLDLQQHKTCSMPSIARRFFHPQETAWLQANDYTGFFPVWTAKESYVKYTGEGITDAFSAFSVVNDNVISGCNGSILRHVPFREDYTLCVCTPEPVPITLIEKL